MLRDGEIDVNWNLGETDIPTLKGLSAQGIHFESMPSGESEMLLFNLADPKANAPLDTAASPHPILSDPSVRQAIQLGIDKHLIVESLLGGNPEVSSNALAAERFGCAMGTSKYNPEKAEALLEEAGWKAGVDGIREKNGGRLSLKVTAEEENRLRGEIEAILDEQMKALGIELVVENVPHNEFYEDVKRYKFISTHFPVLLKIVYRFPLIYYRKYVRDKFSRDIKLITLKEKIESLNIKTIVCCSHRPAFWASSLKRKTGMSFTIWGLLSEFGRNLGWKYIFWDYISGYLSPVPRDILDYSFPPACHFFEINLPVRYEYMVLKESRGDHNKVHLVCGFWGQGPIVQIIKSLRKHFSQLEVLVVCGDNKTLFEQVKAAYSGAGGATGQRQPVLQERS